MRMSGDCILASNIVIDILRGDDATIKVVGQLRKIYVPVIVFGELYYGANKSDRTDKRFFEIEQLKHRVTSLNISELTSKHYGEIKDQLRQKGNLIPENDIWIAAIVKAKGIPLMTTDKHFQKVDGIVVYPI